MPRFIKLSFCKIVDIKQLSSAPFLSSLMGAIYNFISNFKKSNRRAKNFQTNGIGLKITYPIFNIKPAQKSSIKIVIYNRSSWVYEKIKLWH